MDKAVVAECAPRARKPQSDDYGAG